jgi:Tfp pilus assembly protein FimV
MARTRVRWGRVGALLASVGVTLTLVASSARAGGETSGRPARPDHPVVHHYVVRPGDTLWAIASRLAGPDADPRPVVDALVRANPRSATLTAGMRLVVPA